MTRILVVDDTEANLYYLEALLKGHGYTVDSAKHGAEALTLARLQAPDMIVSDLLMPVMDGYTLLREWKADPTLAAVPFVVYTATYTEPEDEKLALDMGADAFFLKPMEPEVFISGLANIRQRERSTAIDTAPQPAQAEADLLKIYSETLVRKLEDKTLQLAESNCALQADIARREAAEDALRISEERFRLLARATNDVAWDWDLTANTLWWSDGFTQLLGYPKPENVDESAWLSLIHPEDQSTVTASRRRVMEGGEDNWLLHYRMRHADGHWVDIEDRGHQLRDPGGNPLRMVGGLTDISLRLALEAKVRQAQRMEAVGQLTGGVAHDFNNLLTVVLGNAQYLADQLDSQPALQELASMICEAAERGSDLTRRLLAFARKQPLSPQVVDLNQLISGMMPLLNRALGGNIQINQQLHDNLPPALVDAGQLEHALLNLCINGRDAMSGTGQLTIASALVSENDGDRPEELTAGRYALLSVSDTGTGIAAEHLPHIFEPFFSTKPEGKGSGLGLAMVYGFSRQSGGLVTVNSRPGEGTTFSLYLPVADGDLQPERDDSAPATSSVKGQGEHILLLEDDELVREFARAQLASLGYRVTAVAEGPAALAVLGGDEHVDLLFSDMVMPAMPGLEVVRQALQLRPGLAVLFTTGFAGHNSGENPPADDHIPVLYKPYRREALAKAVRSALA